MQRYRYKHRKIQVYRISLGNCLLIVVRPERLTIIYDVQRNYYASSESEKFQLMPKASVIM
jgi:hypothetical protein